MAKKTTKPKASPEAPHTKGAAGATSPKRSPKAGAVKHGPVAKPPKQAAKPASKAAPKPAKAPAKPRTEPKVEARPKTKGDAKKAAESKKGAAPSGAKPAAKPPVQPEPKATGAGKPGRKGITIVTPKPAKKPRPKPTTSTVPALSGSILGMGLGTGRPLIPSGPASDAVSGPDGVDTASGRKPKTPYTKRQLDKFQEILIAKRRELLGDIDSMEKEALKSQSGSLSHLPQHMAEQGSETYEQSLSLDLAAADRTLLREIDGALQRIADRTYGLCERTGKPISKERLAELPWARYSIEAAREMERRTT